MERNLIIKIEDLLEEINIGISQVEIDDYFEDQTNEEFLNKLTERDLLNNDEKYIKRWSEICRTIKYWGNRLELRKIINMIFKIFTDKASRIIKGYCYYGTCYEITDIGSKCDIPKETIIRLYIDDLIREYYVVINDYKWLIETFNLLNLEEQNSLIKALENSTNKGIADKKSLFLICSLYCAGNKKSEVTEKYLEYIEKTFIDLLKSSYLTYVKSCDKNIIINFLIDKYEYDKKKAENVIDNLQKSHSIIPAYENFINACALLNAEKLMLCRKYIQFIVQYDFKAALDSVSQILSKDNILILAEKIKIPNKYIIAWMAEKYDNSEYFKEKYSEDPESFKQSIELISLKRKNYLIRFLLKDDEKEKYIKILVKTCIDEIRKILEQKNVDNNLINKCEEFLKGNILFSEIKKELCSIKNKADIYSANKEVLEKTFGTFAEMERCETFERAIVLLTSIRENSYTHSISLKNFDKLIKLFEKYEVEIEDIMCFISVYGIYKRNKYYGNDIEKYINAIRKSVINFSNERREEIIKNIKNTNVETRITFLYVFNEEDKEKGADVILDNFDDKSELVQEYIVSLCTDKMEYIDKISQKAASKKQSERQLSVKILKEWLNKDEISDEQKEKILEILRNILLKEKTKKIKALFEDIDQLKDIAEKKAEAKITDPQVIIKKSLKAKKMDSILWLNFDTLPKVKLKNSNEFFHDDALKGMIFIYRSQKDIKRNEDGDIIADILDADDLSTFAEAVFHRWIEYESNVKEKWVLPFTCAYGGQAGMDCVRNEIRNWYRSNKIVIAQYALMALSMIKTKEMFMYFYNYEAGCRSSALKHCNYKILYNIADEMKVNYCELFTKIIFNENDEAVLDYGDKKFKIYLNRKAALDIFNEEGKKIRGIPKPQEGNELQQKEYNKYYTLKKDLKRTVKNYLVSLNNNSRIFKKNYSIEEWKVKFINSPILRRLSCGVVWGIYEEGKLIDTFMPMEDGTFNTIDDEEYDLKKSLNDNRAIKAVKKDEISSKQIKLWEKQIEDYEIYKSVKQFE